MRLTLLVFLFFSTIAAYGDSLSLQIDPTGNYYTVTGIDVSGITSTYYQPGAACSGGTIHSGLTIIGPRSYSCSTESATCRVQGATAARTDPSRIIATLIGVQIPAEYIVGATGWKIQTNNGLYCTVHPSITPSRAIMTWTSTTLNVGPPEPVHCSVTGPSELTHPVQQTTGMSSTVHDTWIVRCSDTSAVTISTMRDVKLRSGSDEIDSGLYVEAEGTTAMYSTAGNYPYPVAILSKLKSSTAQPGSYQGSGIITVSWP